MIETIDVCICTYRRAHLADTMRSIFAQDLPSELSARVVVADNDGSPSAQAMVEALAAEAPLPVIYVHAPERNISIARNACLDSAEANWVAFIDDDETAPPDWIATLWRAALEDNLDVVFGPAIAVYPENTPDWIVQGDYHTNLVPINNRVVSTGHTCNVLMRWADSPIARERFLLENGRTGGEDVEFFFRLFRAEQKLGICVEAKVFETTEPNRLNYAWIRQRKFAAGQHHGSYSGPEDTRLGYQINLLARASAKVVFCFALAAMQLWSHQQRRRWALRGWMHVGVCAAILGVRQAKLY